ncbi:MAG: TIM barrel protein [Armatimonadetes bacterium]|nr:TIM barrel protein [Armatimonadota bacterium]
MALTKDQIVQGLKNLGVRPGMVVMAHSSLSAFGEVAGGANTVIEALLEAVGPQGTLLMPAMGSAPVFDVQETPSTVGTITDVFWRRADVTRSIHPTHSAAAKGPLADELLAGHVQQPTAIGPDSPWGRVAAHPDGYILFLGCDQDRNTLLHTAEDMVNAAYLNTIQRDYLDAEGKRRTVVLERFPGPHRDFIRHDRRFLEAGAMTVGKIGNAVCRLMKASEILRLAVEALKEDPAAVLCDNPRCEDCVQQRAALKAARLAEEDFTLSARLDDLGPPDQLDGALWQVKAEGVSVLEVGESYARALVARGGDGLADFARDVAVAGCRVAVWPCLLDWAAAPETLAVVLRSTAAEARILGANYLKLSPWLAPAPQEQAPVNAITGVLSDLAAVAEDEKVTLLIENHPAAYWSSAAHCRAILEGVGSPALRLAFNPAHFAQLGEKPFLGTWNRGRLKKHTAQLMIADGCGRRGWPPYTPPAQGQGEVKELMSILRCRSFAGLFTLTTSGSRDFDFRTEAEGFWHCLNTL